MALYVILSNLTDHGRKTIKSRPERIREVNDEIEAMGGKVLAQYATLGPYDFVNVIEAANNEVIVRISVELGSRGTLQLMTLPAIKADEFVSRIAPA
ncbi:MAG TPA: GYD domain-containing protein [Dehalococcoidia bacterium]|nr:GYD domain-containing protein [Dehalococcoidia bacterium]